MPKVRVTVRVQSQIMSLTLLETAEFECHIRQNMIKWYDFFQALGCHGKVKVTIKGQTSDFLFTEAIFSKLYRKIKHNEKVIYSRCRRQQLGSRTQ